MSSSLLTPFRAALCFLAFLVTSTVAADGPAKRDPKAERAEFIEDVAAVIEVIHESYCLPLENGRLLRWAVEGIYSRRGEDVPDEVAERLESALNLDKKELRAVLARVADDCTNDYRRCADLAFGQMLRHLDSACDIWEQRGRILPGQPIFLRQSIGVRLGKDQASGMPRVLFPFRNGPAYKAGLRSGDVIVEIRRPKAPPIEALTIPTRGFDARRRLPGNRGEAGQCGSSQGRAAGSQAAVDLGRGSRQSSGGNRSWRSPGCRG